MCPFRKTSPAKPSAPVSTLQSQVGLEALSRETGVSVDMLRTFAGFSDPANEHMFTTESACKAFAGAKVRDAGA